MNPRRLAGAAAVFVGAAGLIGAIATPANAAVTGPTAVLRNGTVTITGTSARDLLGLTIDSTQLAVDFGLDGQIDATFKRSRFQQVRVLAGDGDDGVSVTGTGAVAVTVSGGSGNDGIGVVGHIGEFGVDDALTTITGDGGNDGIFAATPGPILIEGGAGDDSVDGGGAGVGQETISLGDGNDRFHSSLNEFIGARSDIVDGGAGQDSLDVEGTFATESVALSASAGHLIIDHDRGRIDADNVEDVSWLGLSGSDEGAGDAISVNDLSGTDVVRFTPNFSGSQDGTAPNNSPDTLTVRGTAGVDHITVSGSGADVTVSGLTPLVTPIFLQPEDTLVIDTLESRDFVDSSGLQHGLVQLVVR